MLEGSRTGAVLYAKDVARLAAFYAEVLGLAETGRDHDHVVLQVPTTLAERIVIETPPVRRDDTALKPVFFVASLAAVREAASRLGGALNPVEREWTFAGHRVCDGADPEGNVLLFRERLRS